MNTVTKLALALAFSAAFAGDCLASVFQDNPADMLAQADANHDGLVTKAEFVNARNAQFNQLDRGKKGYVSIDAVPGFLASTARGAAARDLLRSADRDGDGRVTWAEFATAPTPTFDRADIDRNGRLDFSEQGYFVRLVERQR